MKKSLRGMDKPLLFFTTIMLAFGLLMIFSSSTATATVVDADPFKYVLRQAMFIVGGLFISLFIMQIPTKRYHKLSPKLIIGVIGTLIFLLLYGQATRSAKSWLMIGAFGLQPSEFAKMFIIVYLATQYERLISRNINLEFENIKPLIYAFGIGFLVALQPDFGTAIITFGIIISIFISLPLNKNMKNHLTKRGLGIAAVGIMLLVVLLASGNFSLDSKLDRFNFLNPCSRYQEASGYQVCNGYIAINNGGIFGVGLGNSTQKHLYLPEAHTDFIFPVIVEELGAVGGGVVLLVFLIIIALILKIAKDSTTLRGSIIAYGVASYIFLHIAINLTGVLGIAPLTGVPLPFLSYGGSSLWTLMIGIALVQRVSMETYEANKRRILKKSTTF